MSVLWGRHVRVGARERDVRLLDVFIEESILV